MTSSDIATPEALLRHDWRQVLDHGSGLGTPREGPCPREAALAALLDGGAEAVPPDTLAHFADCPVCRHRVATLTRLLSHPDIVAERRAFELGARGPGRLALLAAAAAAAVVVLVLTGNGASPIGAGRPARVPDAQPPHRERGITTTLAPVIVTPPASSPDTLQWTAVPRADRYQVLIFDREGSLAWESQSADTAVALPPALARRAGTYVWKVEARTGWDRWVASEWQTLTVAP